jgi:tripartite-type tricarboxylate transporter receptor subunit TctC
VLVAYAAKDGTTASDGDGRNSPFTTALLKNLETPGLEVGFLFRRIRDEVMTATQSEQEPFVYGSLSGQSIYLKAAPASPASALPASSPSATSAQPVDEALWDLIKGSDAIASIEEFLTRYPASARAKDARVRLETLKAKQLAAVAPQQPVAAVTAPATAQGYPGQAIKIVVPFPPGGATDILGRLVADQLSTRLGASVIIENRPGAGGNIGADQVAKSKADGYTLLLATSAALAINKSLYSKLPYDPVRDFAPIALVGRIPYVLIVNPKLPARTLSQFAAYAKSKPGLAYGSPGVGSPSHLGADMLRSAAGIDMMHVPYRTSAAAMTGLVDGHIAMMMVELGVALDNIKAGKVRALGIATSERNAMLPDIPTIAEGGLTGVELVAWQGLVAPAGTPRAIVDKLAGDINALMNSPATRERLTALRVEAPPPSTPDKFAAYIKAEVDRWAVAVRSSGVKLD